jgi:hypothetical protein
VIALHFIAIVSRRKAHLIFPFYPLGAHPQIQLCPSEITAVVTVRSTLRQAYGPNFAPGCDDGQKLSDALATIHEYALSQLSKIMNGASCRIR